MHAGPTSGGLIKEAHPDTGQLPGYLPCSRLSSSRPPRLGRLQVSLPDGIVRLDSASASRIRRLRHDEQ